MDDFSFFWHDYETFGRVPRRDRPAQFAGVRTDAELNEIGDPMAGPWAAVLEKLNLSGTQTGLKASGATEQLTAQMEQMQSAMRATRAASLKAAQTLAESYTALVSGVLIGMSDAMRQAAVPAKKAAKK